MASNAALSALQGKGRVLIHCMGGCGRSGMAALRLMIEAGEAPGAALERLRAVRPCAVETPNSSTGRIGVKILCYKENPFGIASVKHRYRVGAGHRRAGG